MINLSNESMVCLTDLIKLSTLAPTYYWDVSKRCCLGIILDSFPNQIKLNIHSLSQYALSGIFFFSEVFQSRNECQGLPSRRRQIFSKVRILGLPVKVEHYYYFILGKVSNHKFHIPSQVPHFSYLRDSQRHKQS